MVSGDDGDPGWVEAFGLDAGVDLRDDGGDGGLAGGVGMVERGDVHGFLSGADGDEELAGVEDGAEFAVDLLDGAVGVGEDGDLGFHGV